MDREEAGTRLACEVGGLVTGVGVLVVTEGTPTGRSRVRECLSQRGRLPTTSGRDKWVNVVLVTMGESSRTVVRQKSAPCNKRTGVNIFVR